MTKLVIQLIRSDLIQHILLARSEHRDQINELLITLYEERGKNGPDSRNVNYKLTMNIDLLDIDVAHIRRSKS